MLDKLQCWSVWPGRWLKSRGNFLPGPQVRPLTLPLTGFSKRSCWCSGWISRECVSTAGLRGWWLVGILLITQNYEEWPICQGAVWPFGETLKNWRNGTTGTLWRGSTKSCTWAGTTPGTSTHWRPVIWNTALQQRTWGPGGPQDSSVLLWQRKPVVVWAPLNRELPAGQGLWPFAFIQHQCPDPTSQLHMYERHARSEKSSVRGYKDDFRNGGKADKDGTLQPGEGQANGGCILWMSMNTWRELERLMEPCSDRMRDHGHKFKHRSFLINIKKHWNISHCEDHQALAQANQRINCGVTISGVTMSGHGPEQPAVCDPAQDNLQRSLSTSFSLWFLPADT